MSGGLSKSRVSTTTWCLVDVRLSLDVVAPDGETMITSNHERGTPELTRPGHETRKHSQASEEEENHVFCLKQGVDPHKHLIWAVWPPIRNTRFPRPELSQLGSCIM